jgi:hypothetical protein
MALPNNHDGQMSYDIAKIGALLGLWEMALLSDVVAEISQLVGSQAGHPTE